MKKKKIILLILVIIILVVGAVILGLSIKSKSNKSNTTTTTKKVVTKKIDEDVYKDLTKIRTTSVKGSNYDARVVDGELIVSFDGKGVKVNGIKGKVKYVADLGNFISNEPTFVAITDDNVYVGEMDSNGEVVFSKINTDYEIKDVYLVNELDYMFGYVKQAFILLDSGELKKVEYNGYSKKASLTRTYENRFIDVFLWGNGGLVLRIDKSKNDLLLAKTQIEEYDEKHEMVVKLDFNPMLYDGKKVNIKYVILSDEGYQVYVITKDDYVLYANQNKDIPNENVLELKKYSNNKFKELKEKGNKTISIIYSDGSSKELNYDILYKGSEK